MSLNILKKSVFIFLIFLSCYASDIRSVQVIEHDLKNETDLGFSEPHLNTTEEPTNVTAVNADDCTAINCQNGGTCIIKEGIAVCECTDDYTGKECEQYKCDDLICWNGGICRIENGVAACRCTEEYTGNECEKHKCDEVKCRNDGSCKVKDGKAVCECLNDYTGDECEKHKCDDKKCQNGGWCEVIERKAVCECPHEYTGDECETLVNVNCPDKCKETGGFCITYEDNRIQCICPNETVYDENYGCYVSSDPCRTRPCLNGGRCYSIGSNFTCICRRPYTGQFCESDPCSNNPCMNGGQCHIVGRNFRCLCKEPYVGRFCEIDLCGGDLCKNGGICKVIRGEAKCFCKEPYAGRYCDLRMEICAENVCYNGGICRELFNGSKTCFCMEPYGGRFCETNSMRNMVLFPISLIIASVLTLIVTSGACLLCHRVCLKKKKQTV